MGDYALKARVADGTRVQYEPNDGNLSASNGSIIICFWLRGVGLDMGSLFDIAGNENFQLWLCRVLVINIALAGPNGSGGVWSGGHTTLNDGAWHFVVCEADYSGGAGNGVLRLWVDGDLKIEQTGRTWGAPSTLSDFYLGSDEYGGLGKGEANADIDEFCVFDGYGTEAERDRLYNGGDGIDPTPADAFANATMIFRVGFDAKSAVADYAGGTPEPIGGTAAFTDGFLFGKQLDWEELTFTLNPMPSLTFTVEGNEL